MKNNHINSDKITSASHFNYTQILLIFNLIFFSFLLIYPYLFFLFNFIILVIFNILKYLSLYLSYSNSAFEKKITKYLDLRYNKYFLDSTYIKFHQSNICLKYGNDFPIYTIFVPLYKEAEKIVTIFGMLDNLNYPKHKLDVKIIIEEDDLVTKKAIYNRGELPSYIHIIETPFSMPRTKPKAMNYAAKFIKGEYLTIYDAEDIADPNQLINVLIYFQFLPKKYACIQAKLNFYNHSENVISKYFSIEYGTWFNMFILGLTKYNLPITLSGTSNHFKVDVLREVGLWDAYNVTEDADLGVRLHLNNYNIFVIDSYTMEEAPITLKAWLFQRIRWIKGFIQTYFVFAKDAFINKHRIKFIDIIGIHIFLGLSSYNFLIAPFILYYSLTFKKDILYYAYLINSIITIAYMYITYILSDNILSKMFSRIFSHKKKDLYYIILLLCWPAYFILHIIAAYLSIFELIYAPFKWNKTTHGKSKIKIAKKFDFNKK